MRGRTAPRIVSAGSDAATPAPMITRSRNMRAVTTETEPIRPSQPIAVTNPLPAAYSLPPTIPRPFTGTLDASLDAILFWGTQFPNTQRIVDTLLRPVSSDTSWPLFWKKYLFL
ncbi:hypothetical protein GQ44DRAFT_718035 [Phaeosphaeriaceae sp. PMI808]|nr:hypothetical protein GQ44DRAFT_718035 [Phaeosphaeriaceae sp. PMI808]